MSKSTIDTPEAPGPTSPLADDDLIDKMREVHRETGLPMDFLEDVACALPWNMRMAAIESMKNADPKLSQRIRMHRARLAENHDVLAPPTATKGAA